MERVRLKVHVKGRVTIPKEFRERLGIKEGDHVEVVLMEDQRALLIHAPARGWLEDMLDVLRRVFPDKSTGEIMNELRRGWEEYEGERV